MTTCRLCGAPLRAGPRMTIARAPSAAQAFAATPDAGRANAITLEIAECGACGLVQSASPATESHRRAITVAGVSASMREHRSAQARRLAELTGRQGARTALVGCGNGYELPILAAAGLAPEGIESGGAPSGYTDAWPVHDGYPERNAVLPGAPYAAFACFNFLEHAQDPVGFLRGIASSLDVNGVGVVEVPDYAQLRRERRAFDYIADHLSYFDADTLRAALTLGGLRVVEVETVRGGENLVAWVRQRPAVPLGEDAAMVTRAQQELTNHVRVVSARGGRAAVWGASHQALTLLAGVEPGLVTCIIDSAVAKQGRFAPSSGLPVLAPGPEALAGVQSVVIIASGYVDEIRARLAALGYSGGVHVIRDARVVDVG